MMTIDGAMQAYALTVDKFLDHAAKWHPDAQVVTGGTHGGNSRIGYAALRRRARRMSSLLAALGVAAGDRVATLAWNTQAHVEAWYAIMGMGASCHTLNPRVSAAQTQAMLAQSGARVLIVADDLLSLALDVAGDAPVTHILTIDGASEASDARVTSLEAQLAAVEDEAVWGNFDEMSACSLCFTSGTTGRPKGVIYTHRSTYLHTIRLLQADVVGLTSADVAMPVVPMFHANAWGLPFAAPAVGARLVLPGRATDGASLARLIQDEGVTVAAGVPTVWLGLVEHLEAQGGEVPSLQRIMVGGAAMPQALMRRIEERLDATIQTSWGMTELSPLGTMSPPNDPARQSRLSGRPAIGVDLLLTDAAGRALPRQRDVEGHLRVRGAAVVERYLGQDEPATDKDGWFDTGDLARLDTSGNLIVTGRAKELIKSGGEWINPAEMEAIVADLPQVSLAAVIGRPDPKWGERPILIVELKTGETLSDQELLATLRTRFPSWWIPDEIVRLTRMPTAATGKVDKLRLRAEYGSA